MTTTELDNLSKMNSGNAAVRLWTPEELTAIASGNADPREVTLFANMTSYNAQEWEARRHVKVKTYVAQFEHSPSIEFQAVNDMTARWYCAVQYRYTDGIVERTITQREVDLIA